MWTIEYDSESVLQLGDILVHSDDRDRIGYGLMALTYGIDPSGGFRESQ